MVARIGTIGSLAVTVFILVMYFLFPQPMLRDITLALHFYGLHVLPSAAWLAISDYFGFLAAFFAFRWASERVWRTLESRCSPRPAIALPAPRMSLDMLADSIFASHASAIRRNIGGASPLRASLPERTPLSMTINNSFLLNLEYKGIEAILTFANADKDGFMSKLQAAEVSAGDMLVQLADGFLNAKLGSNPLFALFLPEFESGVKSEEQSLLAEASSDTELLYQTAVSYFESEAAKVQAQLAALPAKPAAQQVPVAVPASAPAPSLSAVELGTEPLA